MGEIQDRLREKGFSVFGSSGLGEKVEDNRQYGQKIFSVLNIPIKPSKDFYNIDKMIFFLRNNKGKWVVKQNGNFDKTLNYVGNLDSAEDSISILKRYKKILNKDNIYFDMQEKIDGVEIAFGRYFNGTEWVGPICMNVEHKGLFNNNLGPKGEEMGSLVWYDEKENKFFKEVLEKMTPFLKKTNYKGYFDINCIVNESGAYPLESTSRLAYPTTQAQMSLVTSPLGEFFKALADGKKYDLKFKKGYAVLVFIGTPPYPYKNNSIYNSPDGLEIYFKNFSKEKLQDIYFEEVSIFENSKRKVYKICSKSGYIAHIVGVGKTIKKARENVYENIKNIVIPKMFYRTDIGLKFEKEDMKKLRKWGWL
ncbi:MAG TPA: phosphoribosylglycinamide synthetase C domain-containing protein [Candidatus Moranbacteria bacterium]|nr:phosphoribosylglycinamide synthetase C domain-containing protein [Candidatus Moranbacteria bacterium]